jgi:hypothetical protein
VKVICRLSYSVGSPYLFDLQPVVLAIEIRILRLKGKLEFK